MAAPVVGVGDLVNNCVVIYRLSVKYDDAPREFDEIAEKAKGVAVVLERINREIALDGSIGERAGSQAYSQLYDLLVALRRDLDGLKELAVKYDKRHDQGAGRRAWFQLKYGNDVNDLRRRLGWHEQRLQMWSDMITWGSHRRMEGGSEQILRAIRAIDALRKDRLDAVVRQLTRGRTELLEDELSRAGLASADIDASIGAAVEYALADPLERVRMAAQVRQRVATGGTSPPAPQAPFPPVGSPPPDSGRWWGTGKGADPISPPPPYPGNKTRYDGLAVAGAGSIMIKNKYEAIKARRSSARTARDDVAFEDICDRYAGRDSSSSQPEPRPSVVLSRHREVSTKGREFNTVTVTRDDGTTRAKKTTEYKDDAGETQNTLRLADKWSDKARGKSPDPSLHIPTEKARGKSPSPDPSLLSPTHAEKGRSRDSGGGSSSGASSASSAKQRGVSNDRAARSPGPKRKGSPPTLMVQRSNSTTAGRPAQRYRDEKTTTRYMVSKDGPSSGKEQVLIVPAAPRRHHARRQSELPVSRPLQSPLLVVPDSANTHPSSAPESEIVTVEPGRHVVTVEPSKPGKPVGLGLDVGDDARQNGRADKSDYRLERRYAHADGDVVVIEERAPRRHRRTESGSSVRDSSTHSYVRRRPSSERASDAGDGKSIRVISKMDRIDSAGLDEG